MFYTYILKSLRDGSYYYGHSEDVDARLKIHNAGRERYTKGHIPYTIHYTEKFETRKEAIASEKFFKWIDGYNWLRSNKIV